MVLPDWAVEFESLDYRILFHVVVSIQSQKR